MTNDQLTMKLKFMSSTDNNEKRMLHTKCDSVVIMINKDTYDIIQQLSDSLLNRYKKRSGRIYRG